MINEGAKILEEGIAARASDIDVVWVNGYGFPIGKGGPMFWAGLKGLERSSSGCDTGMGGPAGRLQAVAVASETGRSGQHVFGRL